MLMFCLTSALTMGEEVYPAGSLFPLSAYYVKRFQNLSAAQVEEEQKKIYHKPLFRLPTAQELFAAYEKGRARLDDMDKRQKEIVARFLNARDEKAKKVFAAAVVDTEVEEVEKDKSKKTKK